MSLELALRLADAADAVTLPAFTGGSISVSTKPDGSVVTDADMAAESAIRTILGEEAPGDGVVGEEHGATGQVLRRWYVDPIDGTSSFVAGHPEWATMVALEVGGVIEVAVVSSPALGRRWYARRGDGAWAVPLGPHSAAPAALSVSKVDSPSLARVAAWPPSRRLVAGWRDVVDGFVAAAASSAATVHGLDRKPSRDTGFPGVGMLVAAGALDGVLICGAGPWDLAPYVLIVEEAGGRYADLGADRRLDTGAGLFTNGVLHETMLDWARAD